MWGLNMSDLWKYRYGKFFIAATAFFFAAFEIVRLGWGEIQETFLLRLTLALLLNLSILITALIGERNNSQKRNQIILIVLLLYALADMFALNSSWFRSPWKVFLVGGCYLAGHCILLVLLCKTGKIFRYQYVVLLTVIVTAAFVLFADRENLNHIPAFFLYASILAAIFACSLNNSYYRFGCIVFLLGDLIGLGHMTIPAMNNPFAHVLSLGIYYTGMMGFASSTYQNGEDGRLYD